MIPFILPPISLFQPCKYQSRLFDHGIYYWLELLRSLSISKLSIFNHFICHWRQAFLLENFYILQPYHSNSKMNLSITEISNKTLTSFSLDYVYALLKELKLKLWPFWYYTPFDRGQTKTGDITGLLRTSHTFRPRFW